MKRSKRERLEAAGWKVGSAKDFLGLTPEETAFVELKITWSERNAKKALLCDLCADLCDLCG